MALARGAGAGSGCWPVRRPPKDWLSNSLVVSSCVRIFREVTQESEERRRLPDEEPVGSQTRQSCHCGPLRFSWTNNGACRQVATEECGRLGHDQVGLKVLSPKGRSIQIRKGHLNACHCIHDIC